MPPVIEPRPESQRTAVEPLRRKRVSPARQPAWRRRGVHLLLGFVTLGVGFLVTVPVMFVVGIAALVLTIIAAMKANDGIRYRYPFTIRLIK